MAVSENLRNVDSFRAAREALIAEERKLGHHHLEKALTTKESRAVAVVEGLKAHEQDNHWQDGIHHPAMPFTAARTKIEQSKLFALIKEMPKACLLHCHLDAMNYPEALLRLAFSHPSLCVTSTAAADSQDAIIVFQHIPQNYNDLQSSTALSLHSSSYVEGTPIPVSVARENHPGGSAAFDDYVIRQLTVTEESKDWTPKQVWDHFGATFLVSRGLLGYEPVWKSYIQEVFELCRKDGIPYLECRINFLDEFIVSASGELDLPHASWILLFQEAIQAVKESADEGHPFWGARIIYTTIRFIEPGEGKGCLRYYLEDCLAMKKLFPDLIAGFDLVGWEDGLRPLSDYTEDLLWFLERQKEEGLEIPYLFHAGETVGDGNKADKNLYDAILLGTKRIGHGFSLPQHPRLMEMCKEQKIAVECCPISNELLRYTSSAVSSHPITLLLNNSIPVSLSCDDPQFFRNYGLSYDFYQVFQGSNQMTIIGLGKLARNSIEYSMMPETEKEACLKKWDIQFEAFLDRVLETAV